MNHKRRVSLGTARGLRPLRSVGSMDPSRTMRPYHGRPGEGARESGAAPLEARNGRDARRRLPPAAAPTPSSPPRTTRIIPAAPPSKPRLASAAAH